MALSQLASRKIASLANETRRSYGEPLTRKALLGVSLVVQGWQQARRHLAN